MGGQLTYLSGEQIVPTFLSVSSTSTNVCKKVSDSMQDVHPMTFLGTSLPVLVINVLPLSSKIDPLLTAL